MNPSYVFTKITFVRTVVITLITVVPTAPVLRLDVIIQLVLTVDCELAFFTFEFL